MNGTRWLRRLVLAHALLLCCCMARAQLKLGSNPATINKSSILELESIRQGLLLPRIPDTTVATLAAAPDGTLIYFTGNSSLMIRKNGFWRRVADTVNFWQNAGVAGGDLTGTYPNPSIAANAVTYSKFQQLSATNTLLGRYSAGGGNVQEITLGTGLSFSGNVLNASITGTTAGGDLTGTYPNPTIAGSAVTYGKIQNVSASSLVGRYAGTAGTMQEITLGTGLSFSGSVLNATATGTAGGDLTGTYPNPSIAPNAVTYSKIQPVTAGTILGRYTTGSGSGIVQEITLGSGLTLNNSTGVLSASVTGTAGGDLTGTYPNPTIAAGVVTYSKIQNVAASSLLGRSSATAGTAQEITLGTGLSFSGTTLNSTATGTAGGDLTGTYPNPTIASNAVTYAKFQQLSATNTLLGRYASGAGNVQEISLGAGLSLTGNTLNASAAGTAGGDLTGTYPNPTIANNAVSYAKMQQVSANNRLLGRYTTGAGSVQEITLGTGLSFSSNVLNATAAGTAGGDLTGTYPNPTINTNAVTYAKFQQLSASNTILGRYTSGTGNVQEITLGTGLTLNTSTGVLSAVSDWMLGGNAVSSAQTLGTTTANDLPIITNNAERIRILSSGLVGINTASPSSTLHVRSGTTDASGLRLENLVNTSAFTTGASPIGVDASGNVVRAGPIIYTGSGTTATLNTVSKVWVAELANTASGTDGSMTITIPTNIGFTNILSIQLTPRGGTSVATAPQASVVSYTLTSIIIRVIDHSGLGLVAVPHTTAATRIYIRVEGN